MTLFNYIALTGERTQGADTCSKKLNTVGHIYELIARIPIKQNNFVGCSNAVILAAWF